MQADQEIDHIMKRKKSQSGFFKSEGFKMLKNYQKIALLLLIIFVLNSCEKLKLCKDDKLQLERINYVGNELKINGYYFGDIKENGRTGSANIYFFYRNGVFSTHNASDLDDAKAGTIEFDLQNTFGKKIKSAWGVFQIDNDNIRISRWQDHSFGCETTIFEQGNILNDTTFVITSRKYRHKGKTDHTDNPNSTFYFRVLDEKPDSTNKFIK